ncbi:Hsp20/alpha crystallin family protein [Dokdonella sp.]|uniref:Hsp20/alpha crystallin family protein n=1 Tax=Dokdonella sp. TaxID=2291710 RepID=UPI0025B82623|nr:Hsp20/alpha crystallin family protein [Dokdonella sp.]MBX3692267.1 Hsp20/alpha crystallin family protein [Dokdonella sp.]MCW5567117.1 Hsp20/alpha crystallin family protein [Dokdonella sp.]
MSLARHTGWSANRDLRQFFDRFLNAEEGDQSNVVTSQWAPRVDIREEDKRFVILADVPGVDPAAIEVHMDKGILTIKGERTSEKVEGTKFTRIERSYGSFHRRFALPDSADAEAISATGKHGVLEISIPKKPETTPRRITINA